VAQDLLFQRPPGLREGERLHAAEKQEGKEADEEAEGE